MSGITDTVIPDKLDISAVDNTTITVEEGKLKIKPSFQEEIHFRDMLNAIRTAEVAAYAGVSSPYDEDNQLEVYSAAEGANYLVDTGNTTATISTTTKSYGRGPANPQKAITDDTGTSDDNSTYNRGVKVTIGATAVKLKSVRLLTGCTATTVAILNAAKSSLATAAVSGGIATFDYALSASTTYYIVANAGGALYNSKLKLQTWPIVNSACSVVAGLHNTTDVTTQVFSIREFNLSIAGDKIIRQSLTTISFAPTHSMLVCDVASTQDGASITYLLGDGTNWTEEYAINTKNTITGLSRNPTIIQLNLKESATAPTSPNPSIRGMCIRFFDEV